MNKTSLKAAMSLIAKRHYKHGKTEVRYISRKQNPAFLSLLTTSEACLLYYDRYPIVHYHPETNELYLTTCGFRTRAILNRFNAILTVFGLPTLYHGGRGEWYFHGSDQRFYGGMVFHLNRG